MMRGRPLRPIRTRPELGSARRVWRRITPGAMLVQAGPGAFACRLPILGATEMKAVLSNGHGRYFLSCRPRRVLKCQLNANLPIVSTGGRTSRAATARAANPAGSRIVIGRDVGLFERAENFVRRRPSAHNRPNSVASPTIGNPRQASCVRCTTDSAGRAAVRRSPTTEPPAHYAARREKLKPRRASDEPTQKAQPAPPAPGTGGALIF